MIKLGATFKWLFFLYQFLNLICNFWNVNNKIKYKDIDSNEVKKNEKNEKNEKDSTDSKDLKENKEGKDGNKENKEK